ncbi:MAG: acyl-CoA thioesterase [Acidimicrobiia bacterium]|nr:acyl-CoA thioesterase [Acidimicrobiia bacterium]
MSHRSNISVRFAELDPYGHVNHAVYVTYFEVGRVEALRASGLDLAEMLGRGWQLVVTELAVRYRRPAVANDELVVETSVAEIGGASGRFAQRLLRDGDALCTAEVKAAFVDGSGRPRRIPPEFRDRLAAMA